MEKLTENYFESGSILYADELNTIISKINALIDDRPEYDDSTIRDQLQRVEDAISDLSDTADTEHDRLTEVIEGIDETIRQKFDDMLEDSEFLDELREGIQSGSNFGDQDVDQYLQQIGIITRQNDQVSYAWSSLQQDVDTLSASVNNLVNQGVDQEAIQSAITAAVQDAVAGIDISTMYARKEAESIIEWMYSALKQQTAADKTFNQIVSAGKSGFSSAISEIRTYVEKLKNGDYVSTASLESSVDSAIAGLKASATSNTAKTEIFNKISKNSTDISGIVTSLTGDTSNATIATKIGTWKSGIVSTATLNSATASLVAKNDLTSAYVIATINGTNPANASSSITLSANKINIDGLITKIKAKDAFVTNATMNSTITNTLTAGTATIKGAIQATSFKVMNGSQTTIMFTTMSNSYRGSGYENLNNSGISNGEPIGIVYANGSPKYFFDFAPLAKGTFSATDTVPYSITTGGSSNTVNIQRSDKTLYYVTDSNDTNYHKYITTPRANGELANASNLYEVGTTGSTVVQTSGGYAMTTITIYRQFSITNGVKSYTGNIYIVEGMPGYGTNKTSYKVNSSISTVYSSSLSTQTPWSSTSFNVHCCYAASGTTTTVQFAYVMSVNSGQNISLTDYNWANNY